jgi:hypothetical protein
MTGAQHGMCELAFNGKDSSGLQFWKNRIIYTYTLGDKGQVTQFPEPLTIILALSYPCLFLFGVINVLTQV